MNLIILSFLFFLTILNVSANVLPLFNLASHSGRSIVSPTIVKRRRSVKRKEKKSSRDEPFKANYFHADILVCESEDEEEDYCFHKTEFAVSSNYTFNCYNNFIQIDFLSDPKNISSKTTALLHYENLADSEYVQSQHCTIIKL